MNEKKSSIDSFSVSLGPKGAPGPTGRQPELEPWNILICSDLGFTSQKPALVRIAEWNEFMDSCGIQLSGRVDCDPPCAASPAWVELTAASLRDFSAQSVALRAFPDLSSTIETLQRLLNGKLSASQARAAIEQSSISAGEKNKVLTLLNDGKHTENQTLNTPKVNSPLSAILSMVDTGPQVSPQEVSGAFIGALAKDEHARYNAQAVASYVEAAKRQLQQMCDAVQTQSFFTSRKASWTSLQRCARVLGRKKSANLYVFSASREDLEDKFPALLSECIDTVGAPDIILWDFPTTFTNAHITSLTSLAQTADTYKCMVWASIEMNDVLFEKNESRDSIIPLLQDPRFLPLKKLRSDAASRCLCLFGPNARLISGPDDSEAAWTIPGCWPALIRWLEMFIDADNPYEILRSGILPEPRESDSLQFVSSQPVAIRQEAAQHAGLSLFSSTALNATFDKAVSVIDPEVASAAYASCGFNLLVNRIARLCTIKLLTRPASLGIDEMCAFLSQFLREELLWYGVCASAEELTIKPVSNQTVEIELASDVEVGGAKARFAFTLDI